MKIRKLKKRREELKRLASFSYKMLRNKNNFVKNAIHYFM